MDHDKLAYFKKRLEDEQELTESELKSLGHLDPSVEGVWDATPGEIDDTATEPDELADRIEDLEGNEGQLREIETHWRNIKRALGKVEDGSFGICEVNGEMIEEHRLEVNPSARTCKAHMEDEVTLGE
jgi:RNA polymerase-binding transcription factor DksA